MNKKIIIAGLIAMVTGDSLMAMTNYMPGVSQNYSGFSDLSGNKTAVLSVERTHISKSGLKTGTIVSLGYENDKKINLFGIESTTAAGMQISYGKMDYEGNGNSASYSRIDAYKQFGKDMWRLGAGHINAYMGLKTQMVLMGGLKNKGIGMGPYAGIKYKTADRINIGVHTGTSRNWFEGGKFYTETDVGADFSYSF